MKFRRLAVALAAMVAVWPALAQQLVMSRATGVTGPFTLNTATGVATAIPSTATFALRSPAPRNADGSAVTLSTLLAAGSHHSVAGDFSAVANADGSYTGAALNRVYFSTTADCSVVTTPASTITASAVRFNTGAAAVAGLSL